MKEIKSSLVARSLAMDHCAPLPVREPEIDDRQNIRKAFKGIQYTLFN